MQIIIQNAFRILGLPVTATDREITQRLDEFDAYMTIGKIPEFELDLPCLGDIDRSKENIRQAAHALNNNETKLEHCLFWFWKINNKDEQALDALKIGDWDRALLIWDNSNTQVSNNYQLSSLKNIALLQSVQLFKSSSLSADKFNALVKCWSKILSSTDILNCLVKLCPDLSNNLHIEEVRSIVGDKLYASTKKYLLEWVTDGSLDAARTYLDTFCDSSFSNSTYNNIRKDITKAITEKIDRKCAIMEESEFSDMPELMKLTEEFTQHTIKLYCQLKGVLSNSDPIVQHYGKKIEYIINSKAIEYGNRTEDWEEVKGLLESAIRNFDDNSFSHQLYENLGVINKNIRYEEIFGKPIDNAPGLYAINGIGTTLYGNYKYDVESNSYETVLYFVVLFIPIFPIRRYRVIKEDESYRFLGKLSLRSIDRFHIGATLALIIFLFIYFSAINSNTYNNLPRTYDDNSTPLKSNYNNQTKNYDNSNQFNVLSQLESSIESARLQLKGYKLKLNTLTSSIGNYNTQMEILRGKIESDESRISKGIYVNEFSYKSNIDVYNSFVNKYNLGLEEYDALIAKFNTLNEETNEKIDKYNQLIGAE
ncbi:MAG: hypothetical protein J7K53_06530 [Bacteroidales bacterium]|nr:hypothetical protein [Bacteroidales bacterium]